LVSEGIDYQKTFAEARENFGMGYPYLYGYIGKVTISRKRWRRRI
jgi:hypothetical protein